MDIRKERLEGLVFTGLYGKTLVSIEEGRPIQQAELAIASPPPGAAADSRLRQTFATIVLTNQSLEGNDYQEESMLLGKILNACGLNQAEYLIMDVQNKPTTYHAIKSQNMPNKALLFGVGHSEIGLPFTAPMFQPQHHDGCTFLYAPRLSMLKGNAPETIALKKTLWESLLRMFPK